MMIIDIFTIIIIPRGGGFSWELLAGFATEFSKSSNPYLFQTWPQFFES